MATSAKSSTQKSANGGAASVSDASSDVSEQIAALKSDFAGLADAINKLSGAGAAAIKTEAVARAERAGEAGAAASQRAVDAAHQGTDAIADYARNKPFMALAAAAGAGLLIGLLTAPRK